MTALPFPPVQRSCPPPRRQRGGMSVTMMLLMVGLVGMLGLVEIGYLYWAKRDVQRSPTCPRWRVRNAWTCARPTAPTTPPRAATR
jgi:uncharacterized iron-regulated membrane protein